MLKYLRNAETMTIYVKITNTKSLYVTSGFLEQWLQFPSSALDIWYSKSLKLESTPPLDNIEKFSSFQSFVGKNPYGKIYQACLQ